jgi:hypothetical protein
MDVVYEAANLIDARLVRIALEQAGIPAFVRAEARCRRIFLSALERPWPHGALPT